VETLSISKIQYPTCERLS